MKQILTLICCFSLFSTAGVAQKKNSHPAMSDQRFVNFAGQTDMVDANLGQLARTESSSQHIKDYGQKLTTDQTSDFQALSKVAHQADLIVPSAIDKEHNRSTIEPFQKLKGAAFDHRFVNEMIAGDNKAIEIYKKEAADAQTSALRSYAEEAIPILQADIAAARKMETTKAPSKKG